MANDTDNVTGTAAEDAGLDAPKNAMATAGRLFGQLRNQRVRLAVVAASIILYTFFHIGAPMYSAVVVDAIWNAVQDAWQSGAPFAIGWGEGGLGWPILILAILYVGEWAFYYLQCYLMASVAENLNLTLRRQISGKIQRLPLRFFDRNKPGEVLSKVTNDLDRISEVMQTGLLRLITAITTVTGSLIIMIWYSWVLTAVFLVFMALSMLVTKLVARKNLEVASLRQETIGELTGLAEEYYKGRNIIKAYNREEESSAAIRDAAERTRRAAQLADFITMSVNPLIRMIARFSQMFVMLIAGWMVIGGRMTVGVAQAFYQYINQVSEPLTEASYMINSLQSALASAERTFELLDEDEERPDRADALAVREPVRGRIVFDHVRFGYEPDRPLMRDVSFVAEPGRKIAIVGSTGAGKTTLINLLMRFYEIDGGSITLDGVPTADMTRGDLRREFGMVLQDTWLFGGTVAENLAYGKPDATRDEIVAAAKAARADYFIRTLPNGYDTVLDNEAGNLSVGQRQLLTIARVFLTDPPILILDEATSSVDTRTEAEIGKAMAKLMAGRTSFVIAHRLSTIRDADLILYMEHGDIVEMGDHHGLLEAGGRYAALYNSQFA
ncbi:ABC transporter ATP-binding protein [Bifidobacterium scardovii]|uniref:Fatty acid ABC transporter ATP-binding/permease protein n=1 Tax=Bifidobacterium scardovii TaxID=158787 RepID=A0A087D740_9BIFI|nr:ABC transporter ATP-binding protein [Bifidobacterium scardovii]KFI91340.1 ATP-binding cassette, subfamily B [Bifidobacterium scardovii]MDK6350294.1 ABC transporter ATP-binding protein [Bifidobacterium scardovii]MDU2422544.1 ABC transporter ATP-binding protein [Bifidobacterium scardovii]MDU8982422.1 ABC transporter ATP-binding protein [Bifidobacterium scardovii]BAQ30904.1 putative ABC transporter permease and ATP-binding components [Bifidobacterium scardovii JCM 12489 = DSM 13734]